MASNPKEAGGRGLDLDLDKPPIETLTEEEEELGFSMDVVTGFPIDEVRVEDDLAKDENNEEVGHEVDQTGEKEQLERGEKTDDITVDDWCVRYYFPLQEDKTGFSVDDLVWGKVKSHPWWPGQIFDSKYASDMALKIQKKDHLLVAYFGDKTFAWCHESQLKPFQACYSEMEKQSGVELSAVKSILDEVSRRVELGMACHCLDDATYADLKYLKVENAGVKEGTCCASVDRALIVNSFQPKSMLEYISAFARSPSRGFDRLELAIATAQMKAYYRSKGHRELLVYVVGGGLVGIDDEIPLSKHKVSLKGKADISTPDALNIMTGKKPRGRPRKNPVAEDGTMERSLSKLREEEDADHPVHGDNSGMRARSSSRTSKSKKFKKGKADNSTSVASGTTSGTGKKARGRPRKYPSLEDDTLQKRKSEEFEEEEVDHVANGDKPRSHAKSISRATKSIKSEKAKAGNLASVGSNITSGTGKRPRGRPRKHPVLEDGTIQKSLSKYLKDEEVDHLASSDSSGSEVKPSPPTGKKGRAVDDDSDYVGTSKKRRLEKYVDSEPESPSSVRTRSLRIGDRMRRVATQLKETPLVALSQKFSAEEYLSPSELLSQLFLVAGDPLEGCSSLSMIISFFTDFRESFSCNSFEVYEPVKSLGRKRGRKKKAVDSSSETSEPDYMQDSYWSDIVLHSSPEREPASKGQKKKVGSQKKGPKKKAKIVEDQVNASNTQAVEGEGSISKETPTALILSFKESDALPSTADLIKIFGDFGPLREEETEVLRKTSRAKVVFKYRDDAEKAFSSAGKYSVFGPALVSYRLRYSSSPKSSAANSPQDGNDAIPPTYANLNQQAQDGTGVAIANT